MGLTNSEATNSKIVTIVKGKFTIRLPNDSDNPKADRKRTTVHRHRGYNRAVLCRRVRLWCKLHHRTY